MSFFFPGMGGFPGGHPGMGGMGGMGGGGDESDDVCLIYIFIHFVEPLFFYY